MICRRCNYRGDGSYPYCIECSTNYCERCYELHVHNPEFGENVAERIENLERIVRRIDASGPLRDKA